MREREKRVDSVIIRRLGSDVESVSSGFREVVTFLLNRDSDILLEEIATIKADLLRSKIKNPTKRR